MKLNIVALFLAAGLVTQTASAEDRAVVGYGFNATAVSSDFWTARVEKDLGKLGNVTVFADVGATNSTSGLFGDTTWTAGVGAELPLSDVVSLKAGVARTFVNDASDFDSVSVGAFYQGDKWRFAGNAIKAEGFDWLGEASAERKVFGDLAVGVASTFDNSEYFATTVFASYSF